MLMSSTRVSLSVITLGIGLLLGGCASPVGEDPTTALDEESVASAVTEADETSDPATASEATVASEATDPGALDTPTN